MNLNGLNNEDDNLALAFSEGRQLRGKIFGFSWRLKQNRIFG